MKQPKFSITQEELTTMYPILSEKDETPMFVAAVAEPFTADNGETQVPVLLVQKTSRFAGGDFSGISRGWGARILRRIENFRIDRLKILDIKPGKEIPGYSISVVRTLAPQYIGHQPMRNRNDQELYHEGQHVYEATVVTNGVKDVGVKELTFDPVQAPALAVR